MKNKKITAYLLIVFMSFAVIFSGCNSSNKVTDANSSLLTDVNSITQQAQTVSAVLDQLQSIATTLNTQLAAAGVTDSNLSKLMSEIDKVQAVYNNIVQGIADANTSISTSDIENIIAIAQQINSATAAVNPYSTYIGIGLAVLSGIIALWKTVQSSKTTAQLNTSNAALKEIVTGLEKFKQAADTSAVAIFKANQQQSPATKAIVTEIATTV